MSTVKEMQSLAQLLRGTINRGAPLYNSGNQKECYQVYVEAAELAIAQEMIAASKHGEALKQALESASSSVEKTGEYKEAAWILRRCFDLILFNREQGEGGIRASTTFITIINDDIDDSKHSPSVWQDENVRNTTVSEKAQSLADTALVLRSSLDSPFAASAAVETLVSLGIAADAEMAVEKCGFMLRAGLLIADDCDVHNNDKSTDMGTFEDGIRMYRYPSFEEMQASLNEIKRREDEGDIVVRDEEAQVTTAALEIILEVLDDDDEKKQDDAFTPSTLAEAAGGRASSIRLLQQSTKDLSSGRRRRSTIASPEHIKGVALVDALTKLEEHLAVEDRRYRLKTYEKCFVGKEAVTIAVEHGIAETRQEAVDILNDCLEVGLIHHVALDHSFKDEHLFYRMTAASDVKEALDEIAINSKPPTDFEKVQHAALVQRYKQAGAKGLNITEILNSFFGCTDETGWDLVDLQNWRDNMKRWGFGRREDQDDEMVNKLSPLVANIDPDSWDVAGDDEEWESPYGILAQIAIFDQVSRSAFRGTPEAFKWDELAKRATRVAIEKGYFHTAYKSTLNQFLILLPLEHSESWEDQKLGVHLLLQLLSTVAIEDEGLSDYEIVKRLEFSKRLTTAFLEHAQVIAKFKRYPHRNRPLDRTTTLEERIWLASDLVPRWAKSQNPDDAKNKNLIQLPVIPLKRLTRK